MNKILYCPYCGNVLYLAINNNGQYTNRCAACGYIVSPDLEMGWNKRQCVPMRDLMRFNV